MRWLAKFAAVCLLTVPLWAQFDSRSIASRVPLSSKDQANGYVGLDGSSNATVAGDLSVTGKLNQPGPDLRYGPEPSGACSQPVGSDPGICANIDGDYWTFDTLGTVRRLGHAPCVNPQSGATYTIAASDRGCLIINTNSSSPVYTLPQAGTGSSTSKLDGFFDFEIWNNGSTTLTLTPATSTINGAASLPVPANARATVRSNNSNYFAFVGLGASTTTAFLPQPQIVAGSQFLARATNVTTQTLIASVPASANYRLGISVNCTGVAAAGTFNTTVTYVDTSTTSQTVATGVVDCSVLGAASRGNVTSNFRAKVGTAITYVSTIGANSPIWDVTVFLEQITTQ